MASLYRSRLYRTATPPLLRLIGPVHILLYRRLGGRLVDHLAQGRMPVLLLTTVGRKSGRERTHPVGFVSDGGSWLVMGSNGGLPREPAWVINIRSGPLVSIQLGVRRFGARASILAEEERMRSWALVTDRYRFFESYQAAIARQIAVVRLSETGVSAQ